MVNKKQHTQMKILANDGIEAIGKIRLEEAGHIVHTDKIEQADLVHRLQEYDAICVRSATKVRQSLIDLCPNLKAIGRGGVGMDNIDVDYARSKGIAVINTPASSSRSVAELAMAHMMGLSRFLSLSNREMPINGQDAFNELKKSYAKGKELENKTLGVIGAGRIGQEMVKIGLGLGMNIVAVDPYVKSFVVAVGPASLGFVHEVFTSDMDTLLAQSDYISIHIPSVDKAVLGVEEFAKVKRGVIIANASRGGTVDEQALLHALDEGIVAGAGLDVFENEPTPLLSLLTHPKISVTPHIGAATDEAQNKIGLELAEKLIAALS
jgi:D-3-phosphoglycerate dehydrogenase / 2-oxoglutarate reductase